MTIHQEISQTMQLTQCGMIKDIESKLRLYKNDPQSQQEQLWRLITEFGPKNRKHHSYRLTDKTIISSLDSLDVKDEILEYSRIFFDEFRRHCFVSYFSWAVPTQRVIRVIKEFVGDDKILEINAGNGLWSHLLSLNSVNMITTDKSPPNVTFTPVETIDGISAVKKYINSDVRCLMTCWPSYLTTYANDAIEQGLTQGYLEKIIYIGEGPGGCTGDDQLHEILNTKFELVEEIPIPQWEGIHDTLQLYKI